MKNLEQYLAENIERNVIDFRLRAQTDREGKIVFYIHPDSKDGDTPDFHVIGTHCFPIDRSVCNGYVMLNGNLVEFEGSGGAIPGCVVRLRLPGELVGRALFFDVPPNSHREFGSPIKDSDLIPSGSCIVAIPHAHY